MICYERAKSHIGVNLYHYNYSSAVKYEEV